MADKKEIIMPTEQLEPQHPAEATTLGGFAAEPTGAERRAELAARASEIVAQANQAGRAYGTTALPNDRLASELTEEEIEQARVLRDPWAGKSAMTILRHPPGKRLNWKSPRFRDQHGPRGWVAVQHDDAIGRELNLYLLDPPIKLANQTDNLVRRGDVVLSYIDEGIFLARQNHRFEKANRGIRKAAQHGQAQYGAAGRTFGEGLRDDNNSKEQATARGFASPRTREDYERLSQESQAGRKVPGRRMFDD